MSDSPSNCDLRPVPVEVRHVEEDCVCLLLVVQRAVRGEGAAGLGALLLHCQVMVSINSKYYLQITMMYSPMSLSTRFQSSIPSCRGP